MRVLEVPLAVRAGRCRHRVVLDKRLVNRGVREINNWVLVARHAHNLLEVGGLR